MRQKKKVGEESLSLAEIKKSILAKLKSTPYAYGLTSIFWAAACVFFQARDNTIYSELRLINQIRVDALEMRHEQDAFFLQDVESKKFLSLGWTENTKDQNLYYSRALADLSELEKISSRETRSKINGLNDLLQRSHSLFESLCTQIQLEKISNLKSIDPQLLDSFYENEHSIDPIITEASSSLDRQMYLKRAHSYLILFWVFISILLVKSTRFYLLKKEQEDHLEKEAA